MVKASLADLRTGSPIARLTKPWAKLWAASFPRCDARAGTHKILIYFIYTILQSLAWPKQERHTMIKRDNTNTRRKLRVRRIPIQSISCEYKAGKRTLARVMKKFPKQIKNMFINESIQFKRSKRTITQGSTSAINSQESNMSIIEIVKGINTG